MFLQFLSLQWLWLCGSMMMKMTNWIRDRKIVVVMVLVLLVLEVKAQDKNNTWLWMV